MFTQELISWAGVVASAGQTWDSVSCPIEVTPINPMVTRISSSRISRTLTTPSAPFAANPHRKRFKDVAAS